MKGQNGASKAHEAPALVAVLADRIAVLQRELFSADTTLIAVVLAFLFEKLVFLLAEGLARLGRVEFYATAAHHLMEHVKLLVAKLTVFERICPGYGKRHRRALGVGGTAEVPVLYEGRILRVDRTADAVEDLLRRLLPDGEETGELDTRCNDPVWEWHADFLSGSDMIFSFSARTAQSIRVELCNFQEVFRVI